MSLPGREAGSLQAAKGRVLIVEDDPLIASVVAMMIESELGCESVTAHSVAKAADLIDTTTGLGVLDVEVEDGLTFPLALQLLQRGIPCVFVSGSDPARVPPALAQTPFLRKPVSSRDLMAAARQLLLGGIAADRAPNVSSDRSSAMKAASGQKRLLRSIVSETERCGTCVPARLLSISAWGT